MARSPDHLNHPWLVAVWPGMGNVAVTAGFYLMAKLEMHQVAEFSARELFDLDHVDVKDGLIRPGRLPRSRFYLWEDPLKNHDLIVFIGEAQPPSGKFTFCHRLIDFAKELNVEKVFTFAAMATEMRPGQESRVFGAAVDKKTLDELQHLELEIIGEGQISGLNGVLLALAAEAKMRGACLLGEMPHVFSQLPFPKASLAVLEAFTAMARIELDVAELSEQAMKMDAQLGDVLSKIEDALSQQTQGAGGESYGVTQDREPGEKASGSPDEKDRQRIEELFQRAQEDRSKAFELKAELDRLHAFEEFEDRFLNLFQKPD